MKTLFIEAKSTRDITQVVHKFLNQLEGKRLGLLTTIQHLHQLEDVQKILPSSVIGGQVLGCDVSAVNKIKDRVSSFLFIGSGNFHALQIAYESKLPTFILDPLTETLKEISKEEIEKREGRIKGAYLAFLNANKVGIIYSIKQGQKQLVSKDKINLEDKEVYEFICDTLDFNELENFPDIDVWINTACYRIAFEDYNKIPKPIINIEDLIKFQ